MNDFDKRFKKRQEQFDRDFETTKRLAYVSCVVSAIGALLIISGVAFTVYKILAHFGIW